MADSLLYQISASTELSGEPFIRRENVYIIDQNNGSYTNNTVILDCAAVSNAGKWADFQNAYITVPLCVTMTSTYDFTGVDTDFAVGLKNGFHQLIASVNIEYNNTSVVQISNLTNMYISYKLNTSLSVDDVVTFGSQIGFAIDSFQSWSYRNGPSLNGQGSTNNTDNIAQTNFSLAFQGTSGNIGYGRRQLDTTFTDNQQGVLLLLGAGWDSQSALFTKNFSKKSNYVANNTTQIWEIIATIRLKDIADFFNQMPLVRNAYMKMYLNLNQSLTTFTITSATGFVSVLKQNLVVYGGQTNPLLIASAENNNGLEALSADVVANGGPTENFVVSVSVLQSLDVAAQNGFNRNTMLSSCRLYIDLYTMNPDKEVEYLTGRNKTIRYRDIFQYQLLNVQTAFNSLISNGISNLKEIVIVPLISSTYNGTGTAATAFSPLVSPFCSEPASCSPLCWFNQFNIQISGVNVFSNTEQYGFEQYQNELYGVNSVQGGIVDGMTSGLLSQIAFYNNYGYLVANVSRRLPEEDRTPKSVQISGNVLTQVPLDLYVFCVFEKSITIDLYTGRRLA